MSSKMTIAKIAGTALLGTALATTAAGCTSAGSGAAPASSTAATASATATAQVSPTPATPAGCPVDEKTLEAAFHASNEVSSAIVLGGGFVNIKCASGFAIATATPTNVDAARVVFQYDQATSAWKAITGGTGFTCTDYMSAAIANQLGCA